MIVEPSNRELYMLLKCQKVAVRRKLRDRNPDPFSTFEIFDHTRLWAAANDGPGATFHFTLPTQVTESSPLVA
jgi:hypothetical protein